MEKKEYIERDETLKSFGNNPQASDWIVAMRLPEIRKTINDVPKSDVVPWSWLQLYADGKRCNFASDFIIEVKEAWENKQNNQD